MAELNDPRSLARLARDVLAAATEATLLMTQPVRAAEPAGLLHDDDGTPRLWCSRGSSVAVAARLRQPAILTVPSHRRTGAPVTLALAGRLRYLTSNSDSGQLVDVVALTPVRVTIEVGREPNVRTHLVGLDAFAQTAPDPIAGYAARAVAHTNTCHHRELRTYISERFALPAPVVAGAILAHLDRHGATVRWVDAAGAHTTTVTFDRPAMCPADLAAALRTHLTVQRTT